MKIILAIVDELPNATNQCHFHKSIWDCEKKEMAVSCYIRDEIFVMSLDSYVGRRCPNCPLVEEADEVQE